MGPPHPPECMFRHNSVHIMSRNTVALPRSDAWATLYKKGVSLNGRLEEDSWLGRTVVDTQEPWSLAMFAQASVGLFDFPCVHSVTTSRVPGNSTNEHNPEKQ